MENTNVAIVGLGNIGSFFLEQLIKRYNLGLNIICAVEPNDTEGKRIAQSNGVAIVSVDDVISFGDDVDIIFNLTNNESIQDEIRDKLIASGNKTTEIISDQVVRVIWAMLSDDKIPAM